MEPITFNKTADYQHICIHGVDGVFTPALIDVNTLPNDFFLYSIQGEVPGCFDAVSKALCDEAHRTGVFITKSPLDFKHNATIPLNAEDLEYTGETFHMEDYFGVKESIDLQIELADKKRLQQKEERAQSRGNKKSQQHTQDASSHDDENMFL